MHSITTLLRGTALTLCAALLTTRPALANCSAAMESCNSSCDSTLTSGFIVGLAGALGRNNAAYQQGQSQLQQAQACAQRCSAQYDACYQNEQDQHQREEATRRAQQQHAEAQQRAEQQRAEALQRAQAEREAFKRRANRVISPPVTPPLAIKDATPLLRLAEAHHQDGNPFAAAHIYKMIVQGGIQPKHQQAARAALKRQVLDELASMGTRQSGAYASILTEYEPLAVFTPAEQVQLATMAPDLVEAESAARAYLSKNPKGTLRNLAEAVVSAAPEQRARQKEKQQQRTAEKASTDEQERLEQIRRAPQNESVWIRVKGGCLIYGTVALGTTDITWSGPCINGHASGTGIYQQLGSSGKALFRYEGAFSAGKVDGMGKESLDTGHRYEGEYRNGTASGRGTMYWPNGNRYEGDIRDGVRTGRGTFYWSSGDRYEGDFVQGMRTGQGTYWWVNGSRYQGEFINGKLVGQGTLWYTKTDDYYTGEWANDQRLNGTLYSNDGRVKAVFTNGERINY